MKKIHNLTIVGYVLGIFFAIFSGIRYFLIYYDLDRAIVYVLIGVIICAIAFLYNKYSFLAYDVIAIENYIADKTYEEKQVEVNTNGNI